MVLVVELLVIATAMVVSCRSLVLIGCLDRAVGVSVASAVVDAEPSLFTYIHLLVFLHIIIRLLFVRLFSG